MVMRAGFWGVQRYFPVLATCLLVVVSAGVWAVDTDLDGLPDDWELAHGRDPLKADYAFAISNTHSCVIDEVGVKCDNGNTVPAALSHKALHPYAVSVGDTWSCACHDGGSTCWGTGYPATPVCTLGLSDSESGIFSQSLCTNINQTLNCSAAPGSQRLDCNAEANKYISTACVNIPKSGSGFYSTVGKIGHVSVNDRYGCALTDRGVECSSALGPPSAYGNLYGSMIPVDGFIFDPDADGIDSRVDTEPLVPADTDGDGLTNDLDWDDDNDGVPDGVDAAPLDAGNAAEITLPLDGNYKGLKRESSGHDR